MRTPAFPTAVEADESAALHPEVRLARNQSFREKRDGATTTSGHTWRIFVPSGMETSVTERFDVV